MKLFWKLLIGILGITMLSFAVFAAVLLQGSFRTLLLEEQENGKQELQTIWYAFLAAEEGVEETYTVDESIVRQLVQSVFSNLEDTRTESCMYRADGKSVYPQGSTAGELYRWFQENSAKNGTCVWRAAERDGRHWMEYVVQVECGGETYYLEVCRDIEYVYASRETGFRTYRLAFFVLLALSFVAAAVFSSRFTAPIRRLSDTTRAFSAGDYALRAAPRGQDEIADLMRDFNQMAQQLQQNIGELKEHARRQEEFTGAFAHELKTPLTAMIGYSEMLLTTELGEEERRQAAGYIYHESRRLERLAHKMLELIRIGQLGAACSDVQMQQFTDWLPSLFVAKTEKKNLTLTCRFAEAVIVGDADLLGALFTNLVDNSCKACAPGGRICVCGQETDGGYEVTVEDNGCGLTETERGRITEAFYMVDKSRARQEGGAGLGLAICEKIVAAHGASWEITSRPAEGTCVRILFPTVGKQEGTSL